MIVGLRFMKCDADRCGGPAAVVGDAARKTGGFPITGPISPHIEESQSDSVGPGHSARGGKCIVE